MAQQRFFGTYQAVVVDPIDPFQRGRVQVRFPWLADGTSVWAPVLVSTPRVRRPKLLAGDAVYVIFEAGNGAKPVVIGAPLATS